MFISERSVRYLIFLVLFFFLSPVTSSLITVNGEGPEHSNFGFLNDDAIYSESDVTIYGFLKSDNLSPHISWKILNSGNIIKSNIIEFNYNTDESYPAIQSFSWEISLNISDYGSCTCYILVTTEINQIYNIKKPIFFVLPSESEISNATFLNLIPALLLTSPSEGELYSNEILIKGEAWKSDFSFPNVSYSLQKITSIEGQQACQLEIYELLDNSFSLNNIISNYNHFESIIGVNNVTDGFYSIYLWSHYNLEYIDEDNVTYENEIQSDLRCISLKFDNSIPVVQINYDNYSSNSEYIASNYHDLIVLENSPELLFDGSISTDPFWGRSGLTYVWTLSEVFLNLNNDIIYVVLDVTSYEKFYTLNTLNNGNFSLQLTVSDLVGNSNNSKIQISIENLIPIAKLKIDNQEITDGSKLFMSEFQEISLDASQSSDTNNDLSSLKCIWKVNNIPFYEGCVRTINWPESIVDDRFILTLVVYDDDDDYSEISIMISSGESQNNVYLMLILLISSISFVSYSFYRRYNILEDKIPKW